MSYEDFKRLEKLFGEQMKEWLEKVATEISRKNVYIAGK